LAAAGGASLAIVLGAGCGGASKTVVVTRTVDPSSAAAARAAAAAQIAAATHGAGKAGQAAPSATTPTVSAAQSSTAGSATANPAGEEVVSGVLAEADAICVRRHSELSALSAKNSAQQTSTASAQSAAIERRALAELSALKPPAKVARAYRQMLDDSRIVPSSVAKPAGRGQLRLLVAAVNAGVKHCTAVD
jgi:hypothetical protein